MKTLIVYHSAHHGNTKKVAHQIAQVLGGKTISVEEINQAEIDQCACLGFGSGIYFGKHHKELLSCIENLKIMGKKVFIFSTSGKGIGGILHSAAKKILHEKGCEIVGEFACKGYDTFGPLKLVGGINKGCPGEKELSQARDFAASIREKLFNERGNNQ